PGAARGWLRIPHFSDAFYVYKYATSLAASYTIVSGIQTDASGKAVKRYKQFLRSGASDDPIRLLKRAGVDMTSPEPIERVLGHFAELVDELDRQLPSQNRQRST
ncbi:M3 family metallopeptidase, partial [Anoxybacillus geothermalis]|nr:M3 family metallopeptidase [Anoxybacillus geothermalis]